MIHKLLCTLIFLAITIANHAQQKLAIVKGYHTKMVYKQAQNISLITTKNESKSGKIFLVTIDSLYLDFFEKNVALNEIKIIEPYFKPNLKMYKARSFKEIIVGIFVSLYLVAGGGVNDLQQMWFPYSVQDASISPNQQRLNKKSWNIGGKYKLTVQ